MQTAEQLFNDHQHLVKVTLHRTFHNPYNVAKSKHVEYNDLIQYGNLGLWRACTNYNSNKSSFKTFAINFIRWELFRALNGVCNFIKYDTKKQTPSEEMFGLVSMDSSYYSPDGGNELSYHDVISNDEDTSERAIDKTIIESLTKHLSERERKILELKSNGISDKAISEEFNVSPQAINQTYHRIRAKVKNLVKGDMLKAR